MANDRYLSSLHKTLKYPQGLHLSVAFAYTEELLDYWWAYTGDTYSSISEDGNYKYDWSRLTIAYDPLIDRNDPYGARESSRTDRRKHVRDIEELGTVMKHLQTVFPKATFKIVTAVPQYSPEQAESCILVQDGKHRIKRNNKKG